MAAETEGKGVAPGGFGGYNEGMENNEITAALASLLDEIKALPPIDRPRLSAWDYMDDDAEVEEGNPWDHFDYDEDDPDPALED